MLIDLMFLFMISLMFCSSLYSINDFCLELNLFKFNGYLINFSFDFSIFLMIYLFVVLIVFMSVLMFSFIYFSNNIKKDFIIFFMLFVLSMEMLVLSGNMLSLIVSWDILGITSYYLVSYYHDKNSLYSGMVTYLINRLGDGLVLLSISFYFSFSMSYFFMSSYFNWFYFLILSLGLMTKSAQFPFMSWLPMAMSAPTPVSSLVHSSTLVTAGIFMLFKFDFLVESSFIFMILTTMGSITMFMGSMMAIYSLDLKKTVAYSTLSQLGLMLLSFSLGGFLISFYHMIVHAFFKSMMFILVGIEMYNMMLIQDSRLFMPNKSTWGFTFFMMLVSLANLMGLPFTMGWLSKDLILEYIDTFGFYYLFYYFFWLTCCLTIPYSFKIMSSMMSVIPMGSPKSWVNGFHLNYFSLFWSFLFMFIFSVVFSDYFFSSLLISSLSNITNSSIFLVSFIFLLVFLNFDYLKLYSIFSFSLNFIMMKFLMGSFSVLNNFSIYLNLLSKYFSFWMMSFFNSPYSMINLNFVSCLESLFFITFIFMTIFFWF